jgi:hypothetical protein
VLTVLKELLVGTSSCVETEAKRVLTAEKELHIAGEVAGNWEWFVSNLSPDFFDIRKIDEIKNRNDNKSASMLARRAIQMWRDHFHRNATQAAVIKALCKSGFRRQAGEIFKDELVDHVVATAK